MKPLFFFAGQRGNSPELFENVGLGELADGYSPMFVDCQGGPGNQPGTIGFFPTPDGSRDLRPVNDPKYRWIPNEGDEQADSGAWYLGYNPKARPSHEDLLRPRPFDGSFAMLADGQLWLIPDYVLLPKRSEMRNGRVSWTPKREHEEFVNKCDDVLAQMKQEIFLESAEGKYGPDDLLPPMTVEDGAWIAYEALRLNYHVTYEMIDMLDMLDSTAHAIVLVTTVGAKALLEDVAKKKPDSQPSAIAT